MMIYAALFEPCFPATHTMTNDWGTHASSITQMLIGWFVAKSPSFWRAIDRVVVPASLTAVLLGADLLAIDSDQTVAGLVRACYVWTVIVFILGWGKNC